MLLEPQELSPANPSFLDMRNSIVVADRVVRDGRDQGKIWKDFAGRGMGWFAADTGADDVTPIEDFFTPPTRDPARTSVTGTITDKDTGAPIAGATVIFPGHNSGFADSYTATTDAQGKYTIANVLPGGTYPEVSATAPGYEPIIRDLLVHEEGANTVDWSLRRDWAATSGGSKVTEFNGLDYTEFHCGPRHALNALQSTGWSTDANFDDDGRMTPRHLTFELPGAVNVSQIAINPSPSSCGDDASASTGDYRLETSTDGQTWTVASEGHFGVGNRNKMNPVQLAAGSTAEVKFLRYTMLGTQIADEGVTCPGDHYGCARRGRRSG